MAEAKTSKNRFKSSKIVIALFSGARINIAERYCASIMIGMLYPRTTENKLTTFNHSLEVEFTEEVMSEITEKLNNIRNSIIKA